jgi:predicted dehydrogenase
MTLTPEQEALGRRNFLKVLAGTPALVALGAAVATRGPIPGGPVRLGFVGVGGQGRVLLTAAAVGAVPTGYAEIRALADINPDSLKRAGEILAKNKIAPVRTYPTWQEMLQKEDIEAVVMAPPLWAHADIAVGCLEAGKHVLCEKMMAWDAAGCEHMRDAARKNRRVLEIGYQRNYNPMYQAAFDGIFKKGLLGDIYFSRILWHRNGNWRRQGQPPSPDYDPSQWGYPTFEHLLNWRLYFKYSRGLFAELASHQINIVNQVYGASPETVSASGGVYRFKDGRESWDHVYATFDYPDGRTAVFSSVESNAFDDYYEMYAGTKGAVIDASETQAGNRAGAIASEGSTGRALVDRSESSRRQIRGFCSAIRTGVPLATGPDKAFESARACIRAHEAVLSRTRLSI